MDLEYRGHRELAGAFVDEYVRLSGDQDLREVIGFYKCYNACVRAKVEGLLIGEAEVPQSKRRVAKKAARRYFDLACQYARQLPPAMLVITCGLPGTGKSTLARRLGERTGFAVISSDVVRKELTGLSPQEHRYEAFGEGIYSADFTERTYTELLKRAAPLLLEGRSVIIDASFIRRPHRVAAARLAKETGAQFACILLEVPPETVRRRLDRRLARGIGSSDARWETYVKQKRRFERPSKAERERLMLVKALRNSDIKQVIRWLEHLSPLALQARFM
jgi:predicted kinase